MSSSSVWRMGPQWAALVSAFFLGQHAPDAEAKKKLTRVRTFMQARDATGAPAPTNLDRITVRPPIQHMDVPVLRQAGSRWNQSSDVGGRGIFIAARTSKEQETDDKQGDCSNVEGNPVVLYTGNKVESELDFASGGEMGLYLQRTYNHQWSAFGLFGRHWLSNFDYSLVYSDAQNILWAQRPDGRRIKFLLDIASGRWYEDKPQPVAYISRDGSGLLTLHNENRGIETYNVEGFITERRNEQGVKWTFAYDSRYLQSVTHSSGRRVTLAWSNGQLTQVTDPAGGIYRYAYTPNAFGSNMPRLASSSLPGAPETTISYHYDDPRFPGALTGKSFNGARYSTFAYDAQKRATLSEHAGGVERFTFSYRVLSDESVLPPPAPVRPGRATTGGAEPEAPWYERGSSGGEICYAPRSLNGRHVAASGAPSSKDRAVRMEVTSTNPLGRRATTVYEDGNQVSVRGDASPRCPASFKEASYDANGYPDLVHDFADNLTDYDYNAKGLLLKRVEAAGSTAARTTEWRWDAATNRLAGISVAGDHEVTYTCDDRGNVATVTTKNLTSIGQSQQTRVLRFTYTYHPNGLKATVKADGPLAQDDVTETYNSVGDLTSVRNALGHQVTYASYNALGLPRKITGTNGEVTEITYDARGRITSQKQSIGTGWATSSITFDATGNVASVTRHDGVSTRFSYDAARRLMQEVRPMGDGTYAWTHNSYDNASNLTRTEVRHADFPMGSAVTGVIEGIKHDANWNWSIGGWACTTGSNSSIDVHAYADNGVALGAFTANQPSEPGVAAAYGASGNSYRFDIPITLAQRQQLGGKKLTVYGISPLGGPHNTPLPGSNAHAIPEANVVGNVDGITHDAAWNWYAYGWACSVGSPSAINVELYAEGGVHLGTGAATGSIDPSFNATCQANRSAYWYSVPITLEHRQRYGGRALHAVGVSPQGNAHNKTLGNAGSFRIPAAPVIGDVAGVTRDNDWNYAVEGWSCSIGANSPTTVHVYAAGPPGQGAYVGQATGCLSAGEDVKQACQSQGAYWFRVPLDYATRLAHGNKALHVTGISPAGHGDAQLNGPARSRCLR